MLLPQCRCGLWLFCSGNPCVPAYKSCTDRAYRLGVYTAEKLNFPKITIFLKAKNMVFVLLGKEGCLILKYKKKDETVTQLCSHFFTFITYHDLGFLDAS